MSESETGLEPRLQEFINKYKYFKKNSIPYDFLEKQFAITPEDKETIRRHISIPQNKTISATAGVNFDSSLSGINFGKVGGFDNDFKNDPRFLKLQEKLKRDRDANGMRYSYMNYTFGHPNFDETSRSQSQRQQQDDLFLDSKFYQSDYKLNVKPRSERVYHVPAKIEYKRHLMQSIDGTEDATLFHDPNVNPILNKLDRYDEHVNTIYQHSAEMDKETRVMTPGFASKQKNLDTSDFRAVPLMQARGGIRNVDVENCVMRGIPERTQKFKSVGYPNPAEHYFQYIDGDIQHPDHVVMNFPRGGDNTRLLNNFQRARPYKRVVMP